MLFYNQDKGNYNAKQARNNARLSINTLQLNRARWMTNTSQLGIIFKESQSLKYI